MSSKNVVLPVRSGWSVQAVCFASVCALLPACAGNAPSGAPDSQPEKPGSAVQALATPSITEAADDMRTGWYSNQGKMSPSVVSGGTFGQLFSAPVTGQVYAQPLVSQGTLFIATESNDIYGLDPETGNQFWHRNLGKPFDPTTLGCNDLVPDIGITGTPVIDSATNTAYFFSKVVENGTPTYYAHGVDVATGNEASGFPVAIAGNASNAPTLAFDATHHLQRPGLLLQNGVVYAAFGGHCDAPPWQGWVVGVTTAGALKALWTANTVSDGAGIWNSGGGIMSDGPGRLFISTGNGGALSGSIAGSTAGAQASLGEAVVRIEVQGDGSLKAADFFSPYDAQDLDGWDADFASGGPAALPDSFGVAATPHLLVAVGKQGYVYLLNRDDLGGIGMGPGAGDAYVFRSAANGGVWSKPAVWPGDGGYVYIPTASGGGSAGATTGFLDAYTAGVGVDGKPTLNLAATSTEGFGFSSSRPVVTSDGSTNGSAILWVIWAPDRTGNGAQLRAYSAIPNAKKDFDLLYSAPIGQSSKFNPPGVGLGRVYVGTRDGKVLGFGSPVTPVLSAPGLAFGSVVVGMNGMLSLQVTANQPLSISGVTSSSKEFAAGAPLKATLGAGESTTIPVTFTPTSSGLKSAALTVNTDVGSVATSANGRALAAMAELNLSPPVVSFGGTTANVQVQQDLVLSNDGATDLVLSSFAAPTAPFSVVQLPAADTKIAPGSSLTLKLAFDPSALGKYTSKLGIVSPAGNVDVPLSGICAAPGSLEISPLSVDYGRVALSATRYGTFTLTNTGGVAVTVTKSKPPALGTFSAVSSLAEGTSLAPNQSVVETVSFTPAALGSAADVWTINADDGNGVRQVSLSGIGMASDAGTAGDGDWQLNGSATAQNGTITLTPAEWGGAAGSAFWKTALPSAKLDVSFDLTIGGGEGADGMALVLADASTQAPTALGNPGGGLGFAGIDGVALAFDTYQNGTDPSDNFVGLTKGANGNGDLIWITTNTSIAKLSQLPLAPHHVRLYVASGVLIAEVDGEEVLHTKLALPPEVFVGFSGANGGYTDLHEVSDVSIVSEPAPANNGGGMGGTGGMGGIAGMGGTGGAAVGGEPSGGVNAGGEPAAGGSSASGGEPTMIGGANVGGEPAAGGSTNVAGTSSGGSVAQGGEGDNVAGEAGAAGSGAGPGSADSSCSCRAAGAGENSGFSAAILLGFVSMCRISRRRSKRAP